MLDIGGDGDGGGGDVRGCIGEVGRMALVMEKAMQWIWCGVSPSDLCKGEVGLGFLVGLGRGLLGLRLMSVRRWCMACW